MNMHKIIALAFAVFLTIGQQAVAAPTPIQLIVQANANSLYPATEIIPYDVAMHSVTLHDFFGPEGLSGDFGDNIPQFTCTQYIRPQDLNICVKFLDAMHKKSDDIARRVAMLDGEQLCSLTHFTGQLNIPLLEEACIAQAAKLLAWDTKTEDGD